MVALYQPQTLLNVPSTAKKPPNSILKGLRNVDVTLRMLILETYNSCAVETNNTVSKMLSKMTSIAEEARAPSANILMNMRDRRWNLLGHILRMDEEILVGKVLLNCFKPEKEVLFGDVPNLGVQKAIENGRDREN